MFGLWQPKSAIRLDAINCHCQNIIMGNKSIFVTVGTTEFNSLIMEVTSREFIHESKEKGYSQLTIQIGNGKFVPKFDTCGVESSPDVRFYRFKDNLTEDILAADLVISHAGAGSCMEVLDLGKPLIVVINESLMNNHQAELANVLHKLGHVVATNVQELLEAFIQFNPKSIIPYPKANRTDFAHFLDQIMNET